VAYGNKPPGTVDQLLEKLLEEGELDLHGTVLSAALYESVRNVILSELLSQWSGPTLLAQIQPRLGLSSQNSALIGGLRGRGVNVQVAQMREDPNWQFPLWLEPWVSNDTLDSTARWLSALD
jgi:hypothetical protein